MFEQNEQVHSTETPRGSFWLPVIGAGVLIVGGFTAYQGTQTEELRRQFAASQQDTAALRAQLGQSDVELQNALKGLKGDLDRTREETTAGLTAAQKSAQRHADLVAGRLAKKQAAQEQQALAMSEELGKVKETAAATGTRIDGITSDVGTVKTDVAAARTDIERTRGELLRTRGDLGEMSGLIATNSKEIQMLRELGDRNIYEFTLTKSGGSQKVGDILVRLRKADMKRNRFTLDVVADDKLVQKRDKTINEPVQFYKSNARQPYELVVNQVTRDRVVGYLATPKVTAARIAATH
jgi:hypothetical protein